MDRCARCFGDLEDLVVFCPHCAQAHEPVFDRLIDLLIDDRYRIYRRLGQGGLSSVFAATDLQTDSIVVIKISDPAQLVRRESSYAIDPEKAKRYWSEMLERMRREVEHLAQIDHPNIVRFLGTSAINNDLRYVVMEFLQGRTLRIELDERGCFEIENALNITQQIGSALENIHQRAIIHRDVNPSNIMLTERSQPADESATESELSDRSPVQIKLIDFGIARFPQPAGAPPFTRNASLRGTVSYSSPEQCQGMEVDRRSDIYSLAVVCFEMLTGQRPFDGRTPTEIALKHIQMPPPEPRSINPDIPPGLNRVILRALAKNPGDRPESVIEFLQELKSAASQFTVSLVPQQMGTAPEKSVSVEEVASDRARLVRKRRRRLIATALLIALTAGGLLLANHIISGDRTIGELIAGGDLNSESEARSNAEIPDYIPGSDADSLELAARSSQLKDITTPVPFQIRTSPIKQYRPVKKVDQSTKSSKNRASQAAKSSRPITGPAGSSPKNPPVRARVVTPRQIPPPDSQPDSSQSAHRDTPGNMTTENKPNRTQNPPEMRPTEDRQPDLPQKVEVPERVVDDQNDSRRPPIDSTRTENRSSSSNRAGGNIPQIGPKLIQWAGSVNRVRVIKIEMPGAPGTIDIPRVYRDRVGVVEPPNPGNEWKYAILRVFGRGKVSILIRWWPVSQNQIAEFK